MKKSITILPRDPDILSPEITPPRLSTLVVYEGAVWSPPVCKLWSLLGLPVIVSPVATSRQMLLLDYGTAGVDHRRQPECSCYPG